MKKVLLTSAIVLGSLVATASAVSAAEVVDTTEGKTSSVGLTQGDDADGLLNITKASSLNFGSKEIEDTALNFTEDNAPMLTVKDIRGEADGWNVAVSLGEFTEVDAQGDPVVSGKKLKGVKLFYPAPVITTTSTAINPDKAPVGITNADDVNFTDKSVTGVIVTADEVPSNKVLINAAKGFGNGVWTATYGGTHEGVVSPKIELQVPDGNLAGLYQADLTYTLSDGPSV